MVLVKFVECRKLEDVVINDLGLNLSLGWVNFKLHVNTANLRIGGLYDFKLLVYYYTRTAGCQFSFECQSL